MPRELPALTVDRLEALARQLRAPLDTHGEEFRLAVKDGAYRVSFPYSVELNSIARSVPNARWVKADKEWTWPLERYKAARAAREQIIATQISMKQARAELLAELLRMAPRPSVKAAFERNVGEIVLINPFFVAQRNGPALCVIHEKAALSARVEIGERRSIYYSKGQGVVLPLADSTGDAR